jgi:hypothetical protein
VVLEFGSGSGEPEPRMLPYRRAQECPPKGHHAPAVGSAVLLLEGSASLRGHEMEAESIYYCCTIVEAATRPYAAGSSACRTNWTEASHDRTVNFPC